MRKSSTSAARGRRKPAAHPLTRRRKKLLFQQAEEVCRRRGDRRPDPLGRVEVQGLWISCTRRKRDRRTYNQFHGTDSLKDRIEALRRPEDALEFWQICSNERITSRSVCLGGGGVPASPPWGVWFGV